MLESSLVFFCFALSILQATKGFYLDTYHQRSPKLPACETKYCSYTSSVSYLIDGVSSWKMKCLLRNRAIGEQQLHPLPKILRQAVSPAHTNDPPLEKLSEDRASWPGSHKVGFCKGLNPDPSYWIFNAEVPTNTLIHVSRCLTHPLGWLYHYGGNEGGWMSALPPVTAWSYLKHWKSLVIYQANKWTRNKTVSRLFHFRFPGAYGIFQILWISYLLRSSFLSLKYTSTEKFSDNNW